MIAVLLRNPTKSRTQVSKRCLKLLRNCNCHHSITSISIRLLSISTQYDELRSHLEKVEKMQSDYRMTKAQLMELRRRANLKGLAVPNPTFNEVNSEIPLTEEQYFHSIMRSFPFDNLKIIDYDIQEVTRSLPEFPKGDDNWKYSITPTKNQLKRAYVNDYVQWITGVTYPKIPKAMPVFLEVIRAIVDNQGKYLTLDTYNAIIKNYGLSYEFHEIDILLEKMKVYGVFPNTMTYNIILRNVAHTNGKQRLRRFLRLLREMSKSKSVAPDLVTLNIILNSFSDLKYSSQILNEMEKRDMALLFKGGIMGFKIPLQSNDYELCGDNDQLKTTLLNYSLLSFIYKVGPTRSKDAFIQAYIQFKDALKVAGVRPNMYTLKVFMNILLSYESNLPFALAFLNFFQTKYGDFFDRDCYEDQLCEIYAILTTSMTRFSDSPIWSGLVAYFYKKSLNNRGKTKVTLDTLQKLKNRGEELRLFGFNPTTTLTLTDSKVLESILNNLRWLGEDPIFFEQDNTLRFRKAYAAVGCGTDITHGRFNKPLGERAKQNLERKGKHYVIEEDNNLRAAIAESKAVKGISGSSQYSAESFDQWRKVDALEENVESGKERSEATSETSERYEPSKKDYDT